MRKAFLVLLLLLPFTNTRANDFYYANAATGGNTGVDCNNAFAWTDVTNGINVAAKQATAGVGNTLHLCLSVTAASAGTNGIVAAASGSAGSPVIIKFETNAQLLSPAWPGAADGPVGCGAASQGGAIVIHNFSNWVIDLGTNGVIKSTANGTGLANTTNGVGIWFDGGDNLIIRNGTIGPMYVRTPAAGSANNGGCSAGMRVIGGASTKICNISLTGAFQDAEVNFNDGSPVVPTTLPNCQSNTFTAHSGSFFNNTMKDMNRGAKFDGAGDPLIANNDIQINSDNWNGNGSFHSSGFFMVGSSAATFHLYVADNYCHGTQTSSSPTGCFYSTDTGIVSDGSGNSITYIRDIVYGIGGAISCCQAFAWSLTSGNPKGIVQMFFNTVINTAFGNELYASAGSPTSFDHRNNLYIIQPGFTDGYFFADQGNGRWSFSVSTYQGDDYYLGRNACGAGCAFGMFQGISVFSTWKANCIAGSGTKCDSTSITTDPQLAGESGFATGVDSADGSAFYLASTSPARGLGDDLTSLCSSLYGLCTGAPQYFGANGSCGSGCIPQNVAHPDAGAFPYSGGPYGTDVKPQVVVTGKVVIQ